MRRIGGRFIRARAAGHVRSCRLLRRASLDRTVFGGRARKPLVLAVGLQRDARLTVHLRKGARTMRRLPPRSYEAGLHRVRLPARNLRRGLYTVVLRAEAAGNTTTLELYAWLV